jgi:hypothetical protein
MAVIVLDSCFSKIILVTFNKHYAPNETPCMLSFTADKRDVTEVQRGKGRERLRTVLVHCVQWTICNTLQIVCMINRELNNKVYQ